MKRDEMTAGARYTRPAYTVPEQTVEIVEVQPVMVRVKYEDGGIGAIPIRDFIARYHPEKP